MHTESRLRGERAVGVRMLLAVFDARGRRGTGNEGRGRCTEQKVTTIEHVGL
jgi:hypothetical protein